MPADYQQLADAIGNDIASGRLKPGDRLPPQRSFAYERGVAVSTAGRVYAELLRRGLVVGEVGRGTFVAARTSQAVPGAEREGQIDLEANFPTVPEQASIIARAMAGMQRADIAGAATGPVGSRELRAARHALGAMLGAMGEPPVTGAVSFTGSGRQAIAAALSTLVPVGGRIAVEVLSYPMMRALAQRIGAAVLPIPQDEFGIDPDALARAHRKAPFSVLYVQPVMHNPLGMTMSEARADDLARTARRLGIRIVADLVYGFLSDVRPLTSTAPELCVVVDSHSKRIAPGVSIGWLQVPDDIGDRVASTVRGGAWGVPPLALALGTRMMLDGSAAEIMRLKRADARRRQAIMAAALAGSELAADPGSYHLWLKLPDGWRSEQFAAALARMGIGVTPSSAFAMAPGHAPPAIRLALGRPSHEDLALAGRKIAGLLRRRPDDIDETE
ncbi:MAG: PLP-dependent aminotransferase family protein [Proteobacteria bacterium]|nr:PLP-dependent aminotransferase family protein [Pseudomonadota bacterium]